MVATPKLMPGKRTSHNNTPVDITSNNSLKGLENRAQ